MSTPSSAICRPAVGANPPTGILGLQASAVGSGLVPFPACGLGPGSLSLLSHRFLQRKAVALMGPKGQAGCGVP